MPPVFMLIIVVFAVLMVMFGNNPLEKLRQEQEKYGRDPLAREINKFIEKQEKGEAGSGNKYVPPAGSTVYRLPASEAVLQPKKNVQTGLDGDERVRPAPDIPVEQWGSQYPSYMMAPRDKPE